MRGKVDEYDNQEEDAKQLATKCLAICGVPANLKKLVEHFKVKAVKMDMPERISGFAMPDPYRDRFVLVVNGRLPYHHRRFTVAHELYHIIHRTKYIAFGVFLNHSAGEERQANIFATELLMPETVIRSLFDDGFRRVKEYCEYLKVSKTAMEIRLFKELGLPSREFSAF